MSDLTATASAVRRPGRLVVIGGVLAAIVASSIIEAVVASIARAAGASDDFMPLQASAFVFFTVVGLVVGAIGWIIVRSRSEAPESMLRKLVPAVLAISFIPDLAMLASDYSPHSNTVGVVALLVMHVVVAAVGVFTFHKVLPVENSEK
ncbi:DUF6069 family protein [Streptomyces sp. NPDC060223]|uniref:DUF6069 family protein n=1 Tax=unclassified Streptomyces TaxID=2593676 RepID=UPI003639B9CE